MTHKTNAAGTNWNTVFSEAHTRAFNVAATRSTVDMMEGAEKAVLLLSGETQDPQAQHIFMRELGQSELSHFDWLYLLTTLLALKGRAQANAPLPQVTGERHETLV